jgi:hypothetical protein
MMSTKVQKSDSKHLLGKRSFSDAELAAAEDSDQASITSSPRPESAKSFKTVSTTQQTGVIYSSAFEEGFQAQNHHLMLKNSFLSTNWKLTRKFSKDGIKKVEDVGDVDATCVITSDTTVGALFGIPCLMSAPELPIKAGTLLLFELTSMDGRTAVEVKDARAEGKTKVEAKREFIERLMKGFNGKFAKAHGIKLTKENTIVFFVYNGMDFFDASAAFRSTEFHSVTIHIPLSQMVRWSTVAENQKREEELQAELQAQKKELQRLRELLLTHGITDK